MNMVVMYFSYYSIKDDMVLMQFVQKSEGKKKTDMIKTVVSTCSVLLHRVSSIAQNVKMFTVIFRNMKWVRFT